MPKSALSIEATQNRNALLAARQRKHANRRNPGGSLKIRVFQPAHLMFVDVGPRPWHCTCGERNGSADNYCNSRLCSRRAPWL